MEVAISEGLSIEVAGVPVARQIIGADVPRAPQVVNDPNNALAVEADPAHEGANHAGHRVNHTTPVPIG